LHPERQNNFRGEQGYALASVIKNASEAYYILGERFPLCKGIERLRSSWREHEILGVRMRVCAGGRGARRYAANLRGGKSSGLRRSQTSTGCCFREALSLGKEGVTPSGS
jgi:hypothetical protein